MAATSANHHDIVVIAVPFPAQGHLNQLLQLSSLVSSYGIPVHYVGFTTHIRQAKSRVNGLDHLHVDKIHFHYFPTPSFATPPPNPDSSEKFPLQLQPAWDATSALREPFAALLREMSKISRRVVVIHDVLMGLVVQDVISFPNAESYVLNCVSAIYHTLAIYQWVGKLLPLQFQDLLPFACREPEEFLNFVGVRSGYGTHRAGDIHNTSRLIEAPFIDLLYDCVQDLEGGARRNNWAIGPLIPAKLPPKSNDKQHECLEWLDKQETNSVIYISFGTSTSLTDEQVRELALGLEQSGVKFLWVLRDADKGDIFEGEVRRPKLPQGFEERVKRVGMVVREWAPQPEILGHPSTGGFMSHCGWNSCIESITMGVPIAAWPMHSDNPINGALVAKVLKTGVFVRDWAQREETVKASTVENAVKLLMASEEGDEIRKRAKELAANLRRATEEGGVSRLELDSFIAHITRQN